MDDPSCTIEGGTQLKGRTDEKLTNSLRTLTASDPSAGSAGHGTRTTGLSARPSRKQDQPKGSLSSSLFPLSDVSSHITGSENPPLCDLAIALPPQCAALEDMLS